MNIGEFNPFHIPDRKARLAPSKAETKEQNLAHVRHVFLDAHEDREYEARMLRLLAESSGKLAVSSVRFEYDLDEEEIEEPPHWISFDTRNGQFGNWGGNLDCWATRLFSPDKVVAYGIAPWFALAPMPAKTLVCIFDSRAEQWGQVDDIPEFEKNHHERAIYIFWSPHHDAPYYEKDEVETELPMWGVVEERLIGDAWRSPKYKRSHCCQYRLCQSSAQRRRYRQKTAKDRRPR